MKKTTIILCMILTLVLYLNPVFALESSTSNSWYYNIDSDTENLYDVIDFSYDGQTATITLKINDTLYNEVKPFYDISELAKKEKEPKPLPKDDGKIGTKVIDPTPVNIKDPNRDDFSELTSTDKSVMELNLCNEFKYKNFDDFKADMKMPVRDYSMDKEQYKPTTGNYTFSALDLWQYYNKTTGLITYSYNISANYVTNNIKVDTYDMDGRLNGSYLTNITTNRNEVIIKLGENSIYVTATLSTDLKIVSNPSNDTAYTYSLDVSECTSYFGATNSSYDLTDGLVGWWSFDRCGETATWTAWDYSGNNNHGTPYMNQGLDNGTSGCTSSGNMSRGAMFDGVDDYVKVLNDASLYGMSKLTVCAWFNVKGDISGGTVEPIIRIRNTSTDKAIYNLWYSEGSNNIVFHTTNEANNQISVSSNVISQNRWYHVCGVYNGSYCLLYMNSNSEGTPAVQTGNLDSTGGDLFIGYYGTSIHFFNGTIDNVRIYSRDLSPDEVYDLWEMNASDYITNYTSVTDSACTFTTVSNTNNSYVFKANGTTIIAAPTYISTNLTMIESSMNTTNSDWFGHETVSVTSEYLGEQNLTRVRISNTYAMNQYDLLSFNLTSYLGWNPNNLQNVWYSSYTGNTDNSTLKDMSDYTQWFDSCSQGNTTGQVLCMNFNELQGTTAKDSSDKGYDSTLHGMNTGYNNASSGWTTDGKYGNALDFDGVDDYVEIAESSSLNYTNISAFTWSLWIKPKNITGTYQGIISKYNTNDDSFEIMKAHLVNKVVIGSYGWEKQCNNYLADNTWVYIVVTKNSSQYIRAFFDGVECGTAVIENDFQGALTKPIEIGTRSAFEFNGTIDEVRIFNRALSQAEITASYEAGKERLGIMPNQEGGVTAGSDWDIMIVNGTIDSSEVPIITIQQPSASNITVNWFNITASDNNDISSCWFNLNGTNITQTNSSGNWNYEYTGLADNDYTATFYCNDTIGNENHTTRTFTYDTTPPTITITTPTNYTNTTANINITGSVTELHLKNCTTNTTEYSTTITSNSTFIFIYQSNLTEKDYHVLISCYDEAENLGTGLVIFTYYNETYSDETFEDNIYADSYETANITLSLNSGFTGINQTYYTIPFDLSLVNTSSITIKNSTDGNITFTKVNSLLNFTVDGSQSPYYITYDVRAIKKMAISEYGTCPVGYQTYTDYCLLMTSAVDRVTYDYLYYMNVTRNETNQSHILHNQSTSIFTNFGSRNGLTVKLNASSTNTTNTVIGSILQFNVSDSYNNDYSLDEGIYYINVNYYVPAAAIPPGGGGGSSGDADIDDTYGSLSVCGNGICEWNENSTTCPLDCPTGIINDFIIPQSVNYSLVSGITNKNEIIIRNVGNKTIELMAQTVCMEGYEEMCNWNWFLVDGKRSSNKLITLEPFGNDTITLYTLPPLSLTQITYYIHLKFTRTDDNTDANSPLVKYTRVDETIMLASSLELTTKYMIDSWNHELWGGFDRPILNKDNITAGDLVIIFIITSCIVLVSYKYLK